MATYKLVDSEKLDADLTTVADAIRAKTGSEELLSFPEGMAGEVDAVFEAGKKAEYNEFWDCYQENGEREHYAFGFCGHGWKHETFLPKYDIMPTNARSMFQNAYIGDLESNIQEADVALDFKNCTEFENTFAYSTLKVIPEINLSERDENIVLAGSFQGSQSLVTIRKIILPVTGGVQFSSTTFAGCVALKNVEFEGLLKKTV